MQQPRTQGLMSRWCFAAQLLVLLIIAWSPINASQWTPIGPDGGDVRSLSFDPQNPDHILLGTSSGELFQSTDRGVTWSRLAHLGSGDDYVLDHIVFDPAHHTIYVAAWSIEDNTRGDLFRSTNGGRKWEIVEGLHNKSIRSLAVAASDPRVLIVGALDGMFRSDDRGESWRRISPEHHAEIKNIESLAIDPRNPDIVYAGTWHLPWKTEDGGRTWHHMTQGIIDDSDVFSIIVDYSNPATMYLSACSGIYKSENAGASFHKVQGIPFSARRTRMLHQDPLDPNVVYAGTTEGLWKTQDAGATWKRVTGTNVIVNDILVDPRTSAHVLLATDRSGVLLSDNAATSFSDSNRGFAHRQVTALLRDRHEAGTLYAGVLNDKEFGGVFLSRDGGQHWAQRSAGLGTRDVFVLSQTSGGELLAGTNNGIFLLAPNAGTWVPVNRVLDEIKTPVRSSKKSKSPAFAVKVVKGEINGRVLGLDVAGRKWYAATSQGLFISENGGSSWHGGPTLGVTNFVAVRASGERVLAATLDKVVTSEDGGSSWQEARLPAGIYAIRHLSIARDGALWIASQEGAYRSTDAGHSWAHVVSGLPQRGIFCITTEEDSRRMLAAAATPEIYESFDGGRTWHATNVGYRVRTLFPVGGRLFGASKFDGLVAQPLGEAASNTSAASLDQQ